MGLVYKCCCKPSKKYGSLLFCIPLALVALLLSLLFGAWGAWEIYVGATSSLFPNYSTVSLVVFGSIKCLFALFGLLAVLFRIAAFARMMELVFELMMLVLILELIYQWIVWGLLLGGVPTTVYDLNGQTISISNQKWEPTTNEITYMVLFTVIAVAIVVVGYWIAGLFKSLAKVFSVGGNGWELKNYKKLEETKGSDNV